MKNIGEFDEMRVKLHLIRLRDSLGKIRLDGEEVDIYSVKNNGVECSSIPSTIELSSLSDKEVELLAKEVGAFKAPTGSKADVHVNGYGISIKSHRGANPAFLNHTHRAGILCVCDRIGVSIEPLDNIITRYWLQREAGVIGEDVKNSDPNSPFRDSFSVLEPILNYFLFQGTAKKDSLYPADYILDFSEPLQESHWNFSKEDYLKKIWDNIVFSIRSKGIPDTYPDCRASSLMKAWIRISESRYKGALHARVQF